MRETMTKPERIEAGLRCCAGTNALRCDGCWYHGLKNCKEELLRDVEQYITNIKRVAERIEKQVLKLEAAQPRWISIEEQLPEKHGQRCVGLYSQHGAGKSLLFPHVFTWHAYGDNGYVNGPHFSDEGLDGLKVYYWMPLPEVPKEE